MLKLLEEEIIYFSGKLMTWIVPGTSDNFEKWIMKLYAPKGMMRR